jgi:hypothetical protein
MRWQQLLKLSSQNLCTWLDALEDQQIRYEMRAQRTHSWYDPDPRTDNLMHVLVRLLNRQSRIQYPETAGFITFV